MGSVLDEATGRSQVSNPRLVQVGATSERHWIMRWMRVIRILICLQAGEDDEPGTWQWTVDHAGRS